MTKIHTLHLFIYMALMAVLQSCYGGRDGEITDDLPQVTRVSGISGDVYTLYQGDTLRLTPRISYSDSTDTTRYDFRWLAGRSQLIGRDRNLVWPVELPSGYNMAGEIPATFVVRDKENGLEFRQTFSFRVLSSYTPDYLCVYQTPEGHIEWMSLQGKPEAFSRHFSGMIHRISPQEPIQGRFTGALYSTNELAVFTDHGPDYGRCISVRNADPKENFFFNVGEYTGEVSGKMYKGVGAPLDIHNVTFGYGASKYFINAGTLHVFNGLDRKLPIFDDNTWVKSRHVRQAMSSKQFQRYKKATFVLHDDGRVGCYHVYNDKMEYVQVDGQDFRLDELAGCFSEATGQSANRPYHIYLVGKKDGGYKLYRFHVNYINRVVQPQRLERAMDVDRAFAERVKFWWGSFGETYGFYCLDNAIYRFDYYEMETFDPSEAKKLVTFDNDEEVVDVVPLIPGSGLRDEDYCTVVLLYNSRLHASSLHVYETVSGRRLKSYDHIIPGRVCYFTKCL